MTKVSDYKTVVVQIHVDNLVRMLQSAPRTAVNRIVELGLSVCDNPLVKRQKEQLIATLTKLVEDKRYEEIRQWFVDTFLTVK